MSKSKMPKLRTNKSERNELFEFLGNVAVFFLFIGVVYLYILAFGVNPEVANPVNPANPPYFTAE